MDVQYFWFLCYTKRTLVNDYHFAMEYNDNIEKCHSDNQSISQYICAHTHTHTHGDTSDIMFIVRGNEYCDLSSNPWQSCLHFT